ncbi:nucleoside diphosphate kinase regulator [Elongatibacter sediminis]|uniref:Nucleoside diphosphate kinase regulator n=1 Tax=Elongatibacter sediminis TaxID=3119006 RepID=A0AAW9REH8_9GAMM
MGQTREVTITRLDEARIRVLLKHVSEEAAGPLLDELDQAAVVPDEELPANVVRMGSHIRFEDLDTGKLSECTLVYPQDADPSEQRISVLAPVGAALIGLAEGADIEWPLPGGQFRRLKVVAVS